MCIGQGFWIPVEQGTLGISSKLFEPWAKGELKKRQRWLRLIHEVSLFSPSACLSLSWAYHAYLLPEMPLRHDSPSNCRRELGLFSLSKLQPMVFLLASEVKKFTFTFPSSSWTPKGSWRWIALVGKRCNGRHQAQPPRSSNCLALMFEQPTATD